MSELTIIHHAVNPASEEKRAVMLLASRATLAKRRWRAIAEDGREFGFDLDATLSHGEIFWVQDETAYVIEQMPEEVLEIPVATVEQVARVAWSLGNLHFGLQVLAGAVRVTEDPAVLQLLSREGVPFQRVTCVFLPLSAGAHTHHAQGHHHAE